MEVSKYLERKDIQNYMRFFFEVIIGFPYSCVEGVSVSGTG